MSNQKQKQSYQEYLERQLQEYTSKKNNTMQQQQQYGKHATGQYYHPDHKHHLPHLHNHHHHHDGKGKMRKDVVVQRTEPQEEEMMSRPYQQKQQRSFATQQQKQMQYQQPQYNNNGYEDEEYDDGYYNQSNEEQQYGDQDSFEAGVSNFDEEYFSDQEETGFNSGVDQQQQQIQSQQETLNDLHAEADIAYSTIEFKGNRVFQYRDFLTQEGKLKEKGDYAKGGLIFSFKRGSLIATQAIGEDIKSKDISSDLVKTLVLKVSTNYPGALLFSFPTINKLEKEHFATFKSNGDSQYVTFLVNKGELKMGKLNTINVLNRKITNGINQFTSEFSNITPEQMEKDILFYEQKGYALIPHDSPVVYFWNRDHQNDGLAICENHIDTTYDVKMPIADAKKYVDIAKDSIKNKISLGNVTNDFGFTVTVPPPFEYVTKAAEIAKKQQRKNGKVQDISIKFDGFADKKYHEAYDIIQPDEFESKKWNLNITAEMQYVKLSSNANTTQKK